MFLTLDKLYCLEIMHSHIVECDYIPLYYSVYNYIILVYNYIYNYIILVIVIICICNTVQQAICKNLPSNHKQRNLLGSWGTFLLIFFPSALLPIRGDGTPGNNGLLTGENPNGYNVSITWHIAKGEAVALYSYA